MTRRPPIRRAGRIAALLLGVSVAAGCSGGNDDAVRAGPTVAPEANAPDTSPTDDATTQPAVTAGNVGTVGTVGTVLADAVRPDGFELTAARVTTADGEVCDLCLWLAESADQRARGLMFVTDLGRADGMAFRYPTPHTGRFWMKNTILPLSIAFFDTDGTFLDAFDMEPCTGDPCPRYPTPRDFLVAVEVLRGGLAEVGMGPGSTLELLDLPCAAPDG